MSFDPLTADEKQSLERLRELQRGLDLAELSAELARQQLFFTQEAVDRLTHDPDFATEPEYISAVVLATLFGDHAAFYTQLARAQPTLLDTPPLIDAAAAAVVGNPEG